MLHFQPSCLLHHLCCFMLLPGLWLNTVTEPSTLADEAASNTSRATLTDMSMALQFGLLTASIWHCLDC